VISTSLRLAVASFEIAGALFEGPPWLTPEARLVAPEIAVAHRIAHDVGGCLKLPGAAVVKRRQPS